MEVTDAPLPEDLVEETPEGEGGPPYRLRRAQRDEPRRGARWRGPDGVRVLQFGKLRGHVAPFARSQVAFRRIIADLEDSEWSLVGDLPGGTRQPFFGWGDYADTVLIVTEPSAKSMLSARRLARLATAERSCPRRRSGQQGAPTRRSDADRATDRLGGRGLGPVGRRRGLGRLGRLAAPGRGASVAGRPGRRASV